METLNIEETSKNLPQLIVALDEDGNYIHVKDAKEDRIYYCPCCNGIIKPKAYKKDIKYSYQAHFYHVSGGCNEETRAHWLYKNWLFKEGSKFYVGDKLHTVSSVEVEKSHNTSFGLYRPDITVCLENGQTMYFEINFSNAKTENNYFCKWDELHNDVIEVNIKKLINEDYNCKVPTFSLIYSNGKCFKKVYQKRDEYANTIAMRKLEWKRQDKINYKIMWERLDWFWIELQKYKIDETKSDDLLKSFKSLDFNDIEICWNIISKMTCCKCIKDDFRNIINVKSKNECEKFIEIEKDKYTDKFTISYFQCEAKNDIVICVKLNSKYMLEYNFDYIICENKTWIIPPSKVFLIIEKFKKKVEEILLHCENIEKINIIYNWNKAPILYDEYTFGFGYRSRISRNSIFGELTKKMYIKDLDNAISILNNNILDKISSLYINNFCMNVSEIEFYIDLLLGKYKNGCSYRGGKIIEFEITEDIIKINGESLYYLITKKEIVKKFIEDNIEKSKNEFQKTNPLFNMVTEIKNYSNDVWKFNLNTQNQLINISLSYFIQYYDEYKKQITANRIVSILDLFEDVNKLTNYQTDILYLLNTRVAPVMKEMLDTEIANYNSSHLTSVLYKTSEVKTYDK